MRTEIIQSQLVCKIAGFDPTATAAELCKLSTQQWVGHVNSSDYEGGWSVIPLRTLKQNESAHPILQSYMIQSEGEWVDLPLLDSLNSVKALIKTIPFEKKSIRLMKLDPQAYIKEHTDAGLNIENGDARFHIPLQYNDEVVFTSNGQPLEMTAGELWYINADQVHSVCNKGTSPRINLVVDCSLTKSQWHEFVKKEELSAAI